MSRYTPVSFSQYTVCRYSLFSPLLNWFFSFNQNYLDANDARNICRWKKQNPEKKFVIHLNSVKFIKISMTNWIQNQWQTKPSRMLIMSGTNVCAPQNSHWFIPLFVFAFGCNRKWNSNQFSLSPSLCVCTNAYLCASASTSAGAYWVRFVYISFRFRFCSIIFPQIQLKMIISQLYELRANAHTSQQWQNNRLCINIYIYLYWNCAFETAD